MSLINLNEIAFSSQYPIDKIVEEPPAYSADFPAASPSSTVLYGSTVAHNAGANTIVYGMFSIDEVNYYPFGSRVNGDIVGGLLEYFRVDAYNDGDNVYLNFLQAYASDVTCVFYWNMESIK